jgi:ABC-type multidrug transport system ATPase subunit
MGSSGAGKTTLMDVLAQRKDSGRIEGSIMVNGKPQGISFQRTTGYCEQNDVHEPTATVRESLLFSARLRQSHNVPDMEKVRHVESIMDLLELTPLRHAIVGSKSETTHLSTVNVSWGLGDIEELTIITHSRSRFRAIHRTAEKVDTGD